MYRKIHSSGRVQCTKMSKKIHSFCLQKFEIFDLKFFLDQTILIFGALLTTVHSACLLTSWVRAQRLQSDEVQMKASLLVETCF